MDRFSQLQAFVDVVRLGSLSAAARAARLTPAMIGRRLDALESRLGVRLLVRSTRRLTLTLEGQDFLPQAEEILRALEDAENRVSAGKAEASGQLRITAPAGFGRRHVAPLLPQLLEQHPRLSVSLDLTDDLVDLNRGRHDCAIRIGELSDSRLVGVRLAENRRLVVAAPSYLQRHGAPRTPAELLQHNCLTLVADSSQYRGWLFREHGRLVTQRVAGDLSCNDGAVLLDWVLAGRGLAWRSWWEVHGELAGGRLVAVLSEFAAPPNGIHVVFAQREHLPAKVRRFIEFLRKHYGDPAYWEDTPAGAAATAASGNAPPTLG